MILDIFNNKAFHMMNLTDTLNRRNVFPTFFNSRGLFSEQGVDTHEIGLEEMDGELSLIQSSARHSPPSQGTHERRTLRKFQSVRLSREAHLNASEIQSVRQFGTEDQVETLLRKANERIEMRQRELDATLEFHKLGAIRGQVLDADLSIIYDWFDEMGVARLTDEIFDFSVATDDGRFRTQLTEIKRTMIRVLAGMQLSASFTVEAVCGDDFYDLLISHPEVRNTYKNFEDARALRGENGAFSTFRFGDVNFINYPASHDAQGDKDADGAVGTVSVASDECRFYPAGVQDLFKVYYTPADVIQYVNTVGLPSYVMPTQDPIPSTAKSVSWEVQSNPLVMCKRPRCLIRGEAA